MMSDLEQRRRTVRVLDLLDDSFTAHQRGDVAESDRLLTEACEVDIAAVSGIQGGIMIGEIPSPETRPLEWTGYVQAAREALAAAEAGEPRA
jgi:hypothetical protein